MDKFKEIQLLESLLKSKFPESM